MVNTSAKREEKKEDPHRSAGVGEKRIGWIDAAKGIAIFFVVAGHCADKNGPDNILLHFSMFAGVSVFFLLSGMTFCWKEGEYLCFDHRPLRSFAVHLGRTLVFPYFFWSAVSIGIYGILGRSVAESLGSDRKHFDVLPNVWGMLYGNSGSGYMEWNRPLWFLVCLVWVEILWYCVLNLLCRLKKRGHSAGSILVYSGMMILPFAWMILQNQSGIHPRLFWELETAVCVLPCFGAGRLLRIRMAETAKRPDGRGEQLCILQMCGSLVCLVLLWCLLIGTKEADFRADRFSEPQLLLPELLLGASGICLAAQILSKIRFLRYAGRRTMAILVMHKFPVMGMKLLLRNRQGSIPLDLTMAVAAVLLCLLVEKILGQICPAVFGMAPVRRIQKEKG